jgi:hypothetical protein
MNRRFMNFSQGIGKLICAALGFVYGFSNAQTAPPLPYQIAGANDVFLGVVWEETAIRKALPSGITPAREMTGGINIYQAGNSYPFGPYQAAYFWVDIEGFDSLDGSKARWMLAGVYGQDEKVTMALKEHYNVPVRVGTSRIETTVQGKRAVGTLNGQDFVTVEVKSFPGECQVVAGSVNYLGVTQKTKKAHVTPIPYVGEICKAEPVSAHISAPADDPFSAYSIAKVVWAVEIKNGSFSFSPAKPAK